MQNTLKQAQEYVDNKLKIQDGNPRPKFHFSTPVGWCNDPNGFSFFNGRIHLFYQHYPYETKWGTMHWGHATTKDLLTWKNENIALAPDCNFDAKGCFSGTAIEIEGKHFLVYTGVSLSENKEIQNQCMAVGNGTTYKKFKMNPIITAKNIPFEYKVSDFRDPKIFKKDKTFYMLCVLKKLDEKGALVLFRAKDKTLKAWDYISVIDESKDNLSGMWECPDYFLLDKKEVIIFSPQQMKENKSLGFKNGNNSVYMTGKLDFAKGKFFRDKRNENNYTVASLDNGLDFYAPQTTLLPDGRQILIAWMQSWESYITPQNYSWSGMMCLPRELKFVDEKLFQLPIKELYSLRKNEMHGFIKSNSSGTFYSKDNRHFDCELKIPTSVLCGKLFVKLAQGIDSKTNKEYFVALSYDASKCELSFSREKTISPGAIFEQTIELKKNTKDFLDFRCIVDTCSIEIFINGGEYVWTNTFYAPPQFNSILYTSTLECDINYKFWTL